MRVQNWPSLLYLHIQDAPDFEWGKSDCVLWCADWIEKATGEDYAEGYRDAYNTEEGAKELLAGMGFDSPSDLADEYLDVVSVMQAMRGDIVLHPTQGCLGICEGMYSFFLMESGLQKIQTIQCMKAWRV